MRRYLIVDLETELPVNECKSLKECAEFLGKSTSHIRKLHSGMIPYSKKSNYRIISYDLSEEEKQEYRKMYIKRYSFTHDRTQYYKNYYKRNKKGSNLVLRGS